VEGEKSREGRERKKDHHWGVMEDFKGRRNDVSGRNIEKKASGKRNENREAKELSK